uniref:CASP-like protein n=1 Tax=Rodentolepis nana TaxID=102285 RepID=A0A0R3TB44_RODNA
LAYALVAFDSITTTILSVAEQFYGLNSPALMRSLYCHSDYYESMRKKSIRGYGSFTGLICFSPLISLWYVFRSAF